MNNNEASAKVEVQLDTVIKLLAAPLVEGKNTTESVKILSAFGLDRSQIAAICNTSLKTVSNRISENKRQPKQVRKGRAARAERKGNIS